MPAWRYIGSASSRPLDRADDDAVDLDREVVRGRGRRSTRRPRCGRPRRSRRPSGRAPRACERIAANALDVGARSPCRSVTAATGEHRGHDGDAAAEHEAVGRGRRSTTLWPGATRRCGSCHATTTPPPSPARPSPARARRGRCTARAPRRRPAPSTHVTSRDRRAVARAASASSPTTTVGGRPVDVDDVALRPAAGQAEALALADGDQLDGVDLADAAPGRVDDAAGWNGMRRPRNVAPPAGRRDEAHVLAVGLGRGAQAERRRPAPRTSALVDVADREQRAGQRRPGRACARRSSGPWPGRRRARASQRPSRARRSGRGGRWRRRRSRAASARSARRANLRWRLHSMHGFGVTPAAWACDVRIDDVRRRSRR